MRWVTHQVAAVAAALIIHLPPAGIAAAFVGGVLPDVFDQKIAGLSRDRQRAFNRVHRGVTHWFGLWLGVLALSLVAPPGLPAEWFALWRPVCFGLALGGLSHVVLDMLTPQGVPLLPFSRRNRFSLRLCRTGGLGEYIFLAAMLVGMGLFLRQDIIVPLRALRRVLFSW